MGREGREGIGQGRGTTTVGIIERRRYINEESTSEWSRIALGGMKRAEKKRRRRETTEEGQHNK